MTAHASFKKRVRARMTRTGEKYGAARRVLLDQAAARRTSGSWVAEPQHPDEAVRKHTGRGWQEWVALIEATPAAGQGHAAVAAWLQDEHRVGAWWAQAVTVGWERITGRRLPNQRADGTFTAGRSATVTVDAQMLRELLLDAAGRLDLFPTMATQLRSRPTSKNVRLGMPDGVAEIDVQPAPLGRTRITVAHAQLASPEEVAHWKAFWGDWLAALNDA